MERRLTTILAADVVGYSRLMGEDEAGTLGVLKEHRREVIDPKALQYGGRIIKLMGDGVLMEFASVLDTVAFAVELQQSMRERNRDVPEDRKVMYRVGINIGDVIVDGDDIYGDGVNVAARLECLAEAGGVCIARNVRDQIRDKLDLNLEDMGEVEVKNIARPVRVFCIVLDDKAEALRLQGSGVVAEPKRGTKGGVLAVLGLATLLAVGAVLWWRPWLSDIEPAQRQAMALPLPDKPSIAVLPFNNMSQDTGQEQFTDGMTEDLITDLSKVSGLFVIARNSTFAYKGQPVHVKKVAEDLGVRYVLEGSVRRVGDQMRVNAQLIDALSGGHVWAERFDGKVTDIFAVQDEFVVKIVDALTVTLTDNERREIEKADTNKIEAREAFQEGWELYSQFNAHDNAKSVRHFERAIALDPEYGRAYGALALVYARIIFFRWYQTLGLRSGQIYSDKLPANLNKAKQYPTSLVHVVAAMKHMFYWDTDVAQGANRGTDAARAEAARAIALQPSDPEAHLVMAWALTAAGKPGEGLNFVRAAKRLNPNFASHYVFFEAAAYYGMGNLERAAQVLQQGLKQNPDASELAPMAASIYAQLGDRRAARKVVESWRSGVTQFELQQAAENYQVPIGWVDPDVGARLSDGLQLAALPLTVSVASLADELKGNVPREKVRIVRTLGWFGPAAEAAVPSLLEQLDSKHNLVRKEAIVALGKIGPKARTAVAALSELVGKPLIGFHAKTALSKINRRQK